MKIHALVVGVMSTLIASTAFAGSVIVHNNTSSRVEVCGGGNAGCWSVEPMSTKGPTYVETDKPFWLNSPAMSRTYSVTADNEH
jgi:hypothetical protein